jgi:transposase
MRRYELTDSEWQRIEHLFPSNGRRGGQWADHRKILDGICWKHRAGVAWRDVPERYGPWSTLAGRFRRWVRDGTLRRVALALQLQLSKEGLIDWDLWCVDGTNIRAGKAAAGGGKRGAPRSPPITVWVVPVVATGARSTSSATAEASRSAPSSRRASARNRPSSSG